MSQLATQSPAGALADAAGTTAAPSTSTAAPAGESAGQRSGSAPPGSGKAASAAKAETARRAAFDKVMGRAPKAPKAPNTPPDGGGAGSVENEGESETAAGDTESSATEAEPEGQGAAPAADPAKPTKLEKNLAKMSVEQRSDYMKARRALTFDGWTQADLDELTPERVVAIGQKRAQAHGKRAQLVAEVNALRSRMSGPAETPANGRSKAPPGVTAPSRPPATARQADRTATEDQAQADRDRLDELLAELDGEERAPETETEPESEPEPPEIAQLREERERHFAERAQWAQQGLLPEFPDLAKPDQQELVFKRMDRLDPDGQALQQGFEALTQLMREACYIEFGPRIAAKAKTDGRARYAAHVNGQPDMPGGGQTAPGAGRPDPETIRREAYEKATGKKPPSA